jgi:hypothetical protein
MLVVQRPANLAASPLTVSPDPVCAGALVTVRLTVTNTGEAYAASVTGGPLQPSAPAVLVSSPAPLALLFGGASAQLVWTYSVTSPGPMTFTATVTGVDGNAGWVVTSGPAVSNAITVNAGGVLAAALAAPATVVPGDWFTLSLTVTNSGSADASGVLPRIAAGPGVTLASGPVPAGPLTVIPGASQTFVWTFSATGAGPVAFTATAEGTTCAGVPVLASATAMVQGPVPTSLTLVSLTVTPDEVALDGLITVRMTVSNTGTVVLNDVAPAALTPQGDGAVVLVTAPTASPGPFAPGESRIFTWTWRALRGGTVKFAGSASSSSGAVTATAVSSGVDVLEAGETPADVVVYPQPFNPDRTTLKMRHLPALSRVVIYTVAGEPLRAFDAGSTGMAEWDGRNASGGRAAPGIYFYVVTDPAGRVQKGKVWVVR